TPRNVGGAANQEEAASGKPKAYRSVLRQSSDKRAVVCWVAYALTLTLSQGKGNYPVARRLVVDYS
ncbi:MAG TPA: hypothetical protein VFU37_16940, partial [Pyrinomonadaceae bacterium]|nr:hypothetical protein [Pyrinomonadaceae bacterium]